MKDLYFVTCIGKKGFEKLRNVKVAFKKQTKCRIDKVKVRFFQRKAF